MEFNIKKEIILDALTKVQGITGKKTNILITSNVLISANQSMISVLATDLEIAFKGSYEAEVLREGSTAVPSRKLYEIVREFPSDILVIKEIENKWIKIADKTLEYNIVGMEPEDFPGLPDIEDVDLFEMNVNVLKNMIHKTIHTILSDEGRAHLSGIYFESITQGDVNKIRMISTDGHRLSKIEHNLEEGKESILKEGVIIPKSGNVEVLRIIEGEETVKIGFKDNHFIVKSGEEVLVIRLIEGEFPDCETVIPKTASNELIVQKEEFLMMLKRMSILSSDKYRGVRFKIDKEQVEAVATNPEIGESKEIISVSYKGKPLQVAFNPRYLIETLTSMYSEEVVIRFKDEVNPCMIEGAGDPGFLSVIMPMRI
ncbi:MAG: DNA polymerase III subunit beta [Deltaproteobacteria bacterium]|nr:DNA polymerase III subunit beta [Deltaproteobacteria bacterium]MBW2019020.1 DNA polymerase III subunit beta [Deltaproteobacteria bacterium]MBW2075581.1 DNA polymerase III subunit beta [Deltaproteobacteria bacterium]RLB80707.1 MAG: DNA polymerase III subunit beta [Deltaproteobacteria bacterium]